MKKLNPSIVYIITYITIASLVLTGLYFAYSYKETVIYQSIMGCLAGYQVGSIMKELVNFITNYYEKNN